MKRKGHAVRLSASGTQSLWRGPQGGRVLVEPSTALPVVDLELAFSAGSLRDPKGKEGLAQLTARLIRRGPKGISVERFEDQIARLGARVTVETSLRAMRFRATVIERNLEALVELLADMIAEPAFRRPDLARAKREVQASLRARLDDDRFLAASRFRRTLFEGHPFGRPVVGTEASLRSVSLDDVRSFYRRYVRMSPVIVGAAGSVDGEEFAELVDAAFHRRGKPRVPRIDVPAPRIARGRHVVIVDKPERDQVQLFMGTLGIRTKDPHLFPLMVSNAAFGGMFSSRLMQEVRAKRGWSYGAYSRLLHSQQRDAWYMSTAPAAGYAADCTALQLEMLENWVAKGVTQRELKFAKSYLMNGHCFDRDTAAKRLEARMEVELFGVPRAYIEDYPKHVRKVTRTQANDATKRRISSRDAIIVAVGTASRIADGFEKLSGVSSINVVPFDA